MGNKLSECKTQEAADKLYRKMKDQGGYEHITRNWKYTRVFLKKATEKAFEMVPKLIRKLPISLAVSAIGGGGVLALIACIVADQCVNSNTDIDKVIEKANYRIFSEEKAQKISSIIHSYQGRCRMFANDKQKLCQEAETYERQLFNQLDRIRFSMIDNPQNATVVNLHAWLKGARFHLEMLSDLIHLSVGDASQVQRAADLHIQTLNELVAAVKKQKTLVINLIPLLLGVKLIDKEVGRSVCIFHPCCNTGAIKDKYLEVLFKEQVNPAEEDFKSIAGCFQEQSWAEFSKRFCEARDSQDGTVFSPAKTTAPRLVNLRLRGPS